MLILPALVTLFTFLYWRPHQVFESLHSLTIYPLLAFVVLTYVLDYRTGWTRLRRSPLLVLLGTFVGWCIVTVLIKAPDRLGEEVPKLVTSFFALFFIAQGVQSLRALKVVIYVLMAFSLGLAVLGVEQGLSPTACYLRDDSVLVEDIPLGFDGRSCTKRSQCYDGGVTGGEYGCEHPGWLGTASISGRVRYLGLLEDPNELAWALSMGLPFLFSFYEMTRSRSRLALLIAGIVVTATCVIMTQSRSGQLSLLACLGVYFIRRYRWGGVLAAVIAGLPVLLLGGRSGEEADSSTEERLGCWNEAFAMYRENPFFGVGSGQFTQHHVQTAHDAFLLTLAELGPIGFVLWTAAVYFAIKIVVRLQIHLAGREDTQAASSLAMALLASLVALVVSAVFLSLSYHVILWIDLGLTGALYGAVQKHDPDFRVRFRFRDLAFVAAFDLVFALVLVVYVHLKV
jgi:hypothetical protein